MDRKALIRAYKETPRPAGIYRVRNHASGRSLVGSTVDVPSMLNRQRFQLETGGHPNHELQRDWIEFGADAFTFEALEYLELPDAPGYDATENLCALEQIWMEQLAESDESLYGRPV